MVPLVCRSWRYAFEAECSSSEPLELRIREGTGLAESSLGTRRPSPRVRPSLVPGPRERLRPGTQCQPGIQGKGSPSLGHTN